MLELLVVDGRCHGAVVFDHASGSLRLMPARATVLATGGGACVYPISTISRDKTASGIAAGLRAGLTCLDMEMVQFHPTGLAAPRTAGHGTLLEEELRTLGATLHNAEGERFMSSYDSRGERATRDIVSRACFAEIRAGRGTENGAVILDISNVRCTSLLDRFPHSVRRLRGAGVDLLSVEHIETSPTAHFLMGGIQIDERAKTGLSGLFACGEDAGGVHGGNRLGGNGVSDAVVFGLIAGKNAALAADQLTATIDRFAPATALYDLAPDRNVQIDTELGELMWDHGGLAREQQGLTGAIARVSAMREELDQARINAPVGAAIGSRLLVGHALANKLLLASAILASSVERPATLAAHHRTDEAPELTSVPYSVATKTDGQGLITSRLSRHRRAIQAPTPRPLAA
jgi:aspartate oxidase